MNPKLKKKLRIIAIITTIIWMYVIFRFSADTGNQSHELSDACVQIFNAIVFKFTGKDLKVAISPSNYALIEFVLRKLAHMTIYCVLAINIMIVLFTFNIGISSKVLITTILCFGYALTDEFHQTLVSGRSGQFTDCMIDTGGAVIGIVIALILYCVAYTIMTKYQKRKGIVQSEYDFDATRLQGSKHVKK